MSKRVPSKSGRSKDCIMSSSLRSCFPETSDVVPNLCMSCLLLVYVDIDIDIDINIDIDIDID